MKILVLQGANMNWLGKREPEKYGTTTADELDERLRAHAQAQNVEIEIRYHNIEGEAIDTLQAAERDGVDAVVLNPGGFSYAGYALRDCMVGVTVPVVELHMTNHYARGIHSVTASAAVAVFLGLGIETYFHAFDAAVGVARKRRNTDG
ncbi:type II 3-dehydroquinate dehydratase [Acuticoccus sp. M5D2P5]|uniref:type II 3-dehydroquinate dehydratase n=1 Tax=Acuticoccus kalidii TaxID=2910977 RepID=UPI001F3C3E30|nr:type II 3-dehydroquinate dehydratase [Acuticoccus kalidii]MCF3935215.1 type II 3-dehydroquinate dehydratase [Acuticoccus kalidii]